MQGLIKVISGIMILIPSVISAYKIDIIYRSDQSYRTIETAYKSNSHIKEIAGLTNFFIHTRIT